MDTERAGKWWEELALVAERLVNPLVAMIAKAGGEETRMEEWDTRPRSWR